MFEIDDLEKDWTWSRPFDFIMTRATAGCFSDWDTYTKKAYKSVHMSHSSFRPLLHNYTPCSPLC